MATQFPRQMSDSLNFQHFEILTRPDGSPHVLGQGAMGTTYKARDTNLQSTVVIKVINPQYVSDPVVKKRFLLEAQVMAKVRHPNVATVFHLSECPNGVFFAMEFCDGPDLQDYVEANGALSVADSFQLCREVSSALHAAHERQLVHRDVKPSNLILVKDNQKKISVKVIDFGLARAFGDDVTQLDLTGGGFVGTPSYASPEQLQGSQDLDTRSDIYSLGVTLWFMLCGSPTFNGSQFEVMARQVNEEPDWEVLPPLPDSALAILHRMLKKSPEERHQTPLELCEDIQKCLVGEGLTEATGYPQGSILDTDKFETIEEVGSGQAGKVFSGIDSIAGGRIAIKFVKEEVLRAPGAVRDIRRQLRHLHSIRSHPNILRVIAFDDSESDREARLIMEWVPGTTLENVLRMRRKMSLSEALPVITQLAQGIDFARENNLRFLELAPHQILIQTSSDAQDHIGNSKLLVQPFDRWPECTVKLNPLQVSFVPDDSNISGAAFDPDEAETIIDQPNSPPGQTVPSVYNFCGIVYRLLGGADSDSEKVNHRAPLDTLGELGNEILESGRQVKDSSPAGGRCADVLADLCRSEGIPVPDASIAGYSSERKQTGGASGSSGGKGSTFEQQRNEIDLKLRRLDLERLAAEQEGKLLGREEEVEQQRRLVEEQRQGLERQKDELEKQMEDERQEVEEGKRLLRRERSELRQEVEQQEVELERERQQQATEFKQFLEERQKWEREQKEAHAQHIREQREARERLRLEEGEVSREVEDRRRALEKAADELEARRARLEQELRQKAEEQTVDIQAERGRIEAAQKNLEARLSRQTLDLDEAQRQVDSARQELRMRTETLERESTERAAKMAAAMARQTEDLETARSELGAEQEALQDARETQEVEFQHRWQLEQTRLDKVASEIEARQLALDHAEAKATVAADDIQSLEKQKSLRQDQLLLLEEDRNDLDSERLQHQQQQRREEKRREEREIEDRERIAVRERELDALKTRLEREATERRHVHQKAKAEFGELLTREREGLARERERIEKAQHEGGVQALVLEKERVELNELRAELAEHADRLDSREAEERTRLEQKKEREFARIGQREADITNRRADLKLEQDEIQSRIEAEKHRLAEIAEERKAEQQKFRGEEQDYAERAARFAVVESNAERKLADLRSRIAEVEADEARSRQRHKSRLKIIAAAVVVLIAAGTFAFIKGKVFFDDWRIPGTRAWITHTQETANFENTANWAQLLEQVATTDKLLAGDRKYSNKYTEVLPELEKDANIAVSGLLDEFENPRSWPTEQTARLLASLDHVIGWAPVDKKKLLSARLHLRIAANDGAATAVQALRRYMDAYGEDRELAATLQPDLDKLIESIAAIFTAERTVTRSSELIAALQKLPGDSPAIFLLLRRLKADEARKAGEFDDALAHCIEGANSGHATEDWKATLQTDLDFVLHDLSDAKEVDFTALADDLSRVGDVFRTPRPYMILAEHAPNKLAQFGYYQPAEILGSMEAKAYVGMFLAATTDERVSAADRREFGAKRVRESSDAGDPVGLYLHAVLHFEVYKDLEWGTEPNYAESIRLARLAREKGHPDAEFYEGTVMHSRALAKNSPAELQKARELLQAVADKKTHPEAYYQLYLSYWFDQEHRDGARASKALQSGSDLGNFDCMSKLAEWYQMGQTPIVQNLTKARDLRLELARVHNHAESKAWLSNYASENQSSDEDWISKNRHHWE